MFYTPGWWSMPQFYQEAFLAEIVGATELLLNPETDEIVDRDNLEWTSESRSSFIEVILNRLSPFSILSPGGQVLHGTADLFSRLEDFRSEHVDLRVGTIGSGWVRDQLEDLDPSYQTLELERRYGCLLGCHVLANQEEAVKALREKRPPYDGPRHLSSTEKAKLG